MPGSLIPARENPYKSTSSSNNTSNITDFSVTFSNYVSNTYDGTLLYFKMKRDGNTSDFNFEPSTETHEGKSSFDKYSPWKDIRKCILSPEGEVLCYEGDLEYSVTPDNGDVMVEIPKFWYGIEVNNTDEVFTVHISNVEKEGYYVSPRHQKYGTMTKDLDKIYVSAYPCNISGRSISGTELNKKFSTLYVQTSRGDTPRFYQYDFLTLLTIELLRIVETGYVDLSINANISGGFNTVLVSTGLTDVLPYHSGRLSNSSWKYRGMENLCDHYNAYNSAYQWVPTVLAQGVIIKDNKMYVSSKPDFIYQNGTAISNKTFDYTSFDYIFDLPYPIKNSIIQLYPHKELYIKNSDLQFQDWSAFIPASCSSADSNINLPYGGLSSTSIGADNPYFVSPTFGNYRSMFLYEQYGCYYRDNSGSPYVNDTRFYSRLIYLPQE